MTLTPAIEKKLCADLTSINPIFGAMFRNGSLVFSNEFDTAALDIVEGKFRVSFNARYWKRINPRTRLFVICHEYLHVILGHWLDPVRKVDTEWYGIAQDIQVNEMLIKYFGFVREDIHNWKEKCWIDVVFREASNVVKPDMSCDYYYDLIMRCVPTT
jgi:hypothetical protein